MKFISNNFYIKNSLKNSINFLIFFVFIGFPLLGWSDSVISKKLITKDNVESICTDWTLPEVLIGQTDKRISLYQLYPPECETQKRNCDSSTYLLPGNVVTLRKQCSTWSYIEYTNQKLQHSEGWVLNEYVPRSDFVPENAIQVLNKQTVISVQSGETIYMKDPDLCHQIADLDNIGVLERFIVNKGSWKSEDELVALFGQEAESYGGGEYWKLDLGNTGTYDDIAIIAQGTAYISFGLIKPSRQEFSIQKISGDYEDLSLIQLGKAYYFISHSEKNLKNVFHLEKTGKIESICEFQKRKDPILKTILGQEKTVCQKIVSSEIKHLKFLDAVSQPDLSGDNRFNNGSISSIVNGVAMIDIENKGESEPVISIYGNSGGGRGCDSESLAIVDKKNNIVAHNKANQILVDEIGNILTCGTKTGVFQFLGTTYIDVSRKNGDRSILAINKEKVKNICEYSGQYLTEVVPKQK